MKLLTFRLLWDSQMNIISRQHNLIHLLKSIWGSQCKELCCEHSDKQDCHGLELILLDYYMGLEVLWRENLSLVNPMWRSRNTVDVLTAQWVTSTINLLIYKHNFTLDYNRNLGDMGQLHYPVNQLSFKALEHTTLFSLFLISWKAIN